MVNRERFEAAEAGNVLSAVVGIGNVGIRFFVPLSCFVPAESIARVCVWSCLCVCIQSCPLHLVSPLRLVVSQYLYLVSIVHQVSFLNQVQGLRLIRWLYVVMQPTKGIRHGLAFLLRLR